MTEIVVWAVEVKKDEVAVAAWLNSTEWVAAVDESWRFRSIKGERSALKLETKWYLKRASLSAYLKQVGQPDKGEVSLSEETVSRISCSYRFLFQVLILLCIPMCSPSFEDEIRGEIQISGVVRTKRENVVEQREDGAQLPTTHTQNESSIHRETGKSNWQSIQMLCNRSISSQSVHKGHRSFLLHHLNLKMLHSTPTINLNFPLISISFLLKIHPISL